MKKITMLFALALMCMGVRAQEKYEAYCDIWSFLDSRENIFTTKAIINFDFGKKRNVQILDEDGKKQPFFSYIDAANFMAKKGWKIRTVYTKLNNLVPASSYLDITHVVMVKTVSSDDEVTEGFKTTPSQSMEEYLQVKKEKQKKRDARNNSNIDDAYKY